MTAPTRINLHQQSRELELSWDDESSCRLSCEFLRVHSPSAEVKGHGPGQEVLQTGKKEVTITDIKPVGNYALQLVFDDGHNTGLYTWTYLRELGDNMEANWQAYLDRLQAAGYPREKP